MSDESLDFGSGYSGRFIGWHPDRSIPANAERYEGLGDVDRAMLLLTCPHGDGGIHLDTMRDVLALSGSDHYWRVESWDPLTLSPSIHRLECGCHGFIREGRWVAA